MNRIPLAVGFYDIESGLGVEDDFNLVYEAVNTQTKKKYAIKFEAKTRNKKTLYHEKIVYDFMGKWDCFPEIILFTEEKRHLVLVMELLGLSLEQQLQKLGVFSVKTTMMLALQMIVRIKVVHDYDMLYLGVKPANLVMGKKDVNNMYLVDFEYAKKYIDSEGNHIPFKKGVRIVNNIWFSPVSGHEGAELSRRDDLECMAYCLIYFLKGRLPWMRIDISYDWDGASREIGRMKKNTPTSVLCEGCPEEVALFLEHVRHLQFTEEPDYAYYTSLFQTVLERNEMKEDYIFDWFHHDSSSSSSEGIMFGNAESENESRNKESEEQKKREERLKAEEKKKDAEKKQREAERIPREKQKAEEKRRKDEEYDRMHMNQFPRRGHEPSPNPKRFGPSRKGDKKMKNGRRSDSQE